MGVESRPGSDRLPRPRRSLPVMFAWRRVAISRRVSISLKTDKAVTGVLVENRGEFLVLKDASLAEAGREPVRLDGEVLVDRANVDFVQILAPRSEV